MTEVPTAPMAADTKSFRGGFLLFRKDGQNLRRGGGKGAIHKAKATRARPPRFRHPTFQAAEAEAERLLGMLPDSTFVIIQEVGRVKLKPVEQADG